MTSMSYLSKLGEDEFQAYLISNYRNCFLPKICPKVTRIAGKTISPEIDLLGIKRALLKKDTVIGYEFKLLTFKTSDANYRLIHSGIGQALLYFKYGVDVAVLILGIPNTPTRESLIQKTEVVSDLSNFLAETQYEFDRFKIWTFDEKTQRFNAPKLQFAKPMLTIGTRYYMDDLARENLLAGNFTWTKGKRLLRKHHIS